MVDGSNLPNLIADIVQQIQHIDGIEAIVLGGSRAMGTHTPTSDVDLGIYYHPEQPLDLVAFNQLATKLDDDHRPELLTPLGGWGPWINGGGWLTIQTMPVDFLYRDLARVTEVIAACRAGRVEIAYQAGHPHGFASPIYMAEVALCQPLWDPHGTIAALKAQTRPYPAALRQALIKQFGWEAEFSLGVARKSIPRGDVAYAAGCCFRCVACLLQTLFALNERYWLNEKGAVAIAATLSHVPEGLQARIEAAFTQLAADPQAITIAIGLLDELVHETAALVARR